MPPIAEAFKLSPQQLATFDREGYLVVENLFEHDILQAVIDELTDEIDRRAKQLVTAGELSQDYAGEDFEHRLAKISDETSKLAGSIWDAALAGPAIFNLICYPRVVDVAEQLCGSEVIASSVYRVRPKVPHHALSAVPWHQDSGYFEPYCDKALVLTVWLPLVDANEENGCLWVKPRSHKQNVLTHARRKDKAYYVIPDSELPQVKSICVPVKKGDALLLHNLTPHASFDNKTDRVRWSMDLRYQSAAAPTNAKITRLPGESTESPEENIPAACYPPEADFLVRSKLRPDEVMTSADEFNRLRKSHVVLPAPRRWSMVIE